MKIPNREMSFIKDRGVARVATADADGEPHAVPVCPVVQANRIYFASETNGKKIQNLKHNPKIAIVFDEYQDSWKNLRGVMFRGSAKIVDRKAFNRIRARLYKKYPKYEKDAALEYGESSIVEVTPLKKFSWGF